MNCPNCGAHASRQMQVNEELRCGTCKTLFRITESGSKIVERGQAVLSEVPPQRHTI